MTLKANNPDREDAQDRLTEIERLGRAATRRGLYPRWFGGLIALWASGLAVAIGTASPLWLPWLFAGFASYAYWHRRSGAAVAEVHSRRDIWLVLVAGLLLGLVFIAGRIGRENFGIEEAPWLAGAFIATATFALMEFSYRRTWDAPVAPRP